MFIQCGAAELRFLRNSGAFWGGVFGLIQMGLWTVPQFQNPAIVFPVFGFVVGAFTNYLALKMIFEPVDPVDLCGCYTLQGLFLKRQKEVGAPERLDGAHAMPGMIFASACLCHGIAHVFVKR